jgi:hypothetical protein
MAYTLKDDDDDDDDDDDCSRLFAFITWSQYNEHKSELRMGR